MFPKDEINRRICVAFEDAQVEVIDLTGGQDHYQVTIVSSVFVGLAPLERHRKVYALFADVVGGDLHALSINTKTP